MADFADSNNYHLYRNQHRPVITEIEDTLDNGKVTTFKDQGRKMVKVTYTRAVMSLNEENRLGYVELTTAVFSPEGAPHKAEAFYVGTQGPIRPSDVIPFDDEEPWE